MSELSIRPANPRSKGHCHHCDTRQCIWPACEDINKARQDGYTDKEIIEYLEARQETKT